MVGVQQHLFFIFMPYKKLRNKFLQNSFVMAQGIGIEEIPQKLHQRYHSSILSLLLFYVYVLSRFAAMVD